MSQPELCQLPPQPSSGCCGGPPPAPAAPLAIDNAPGLPAIQYRIGTFTSFRRAMLDQVPRADLLTGFSNPFAAWHEGTDGDYETIFVELWAYIADILTFYQERIANEAYLGTATQRDSSLRLAQLIDYRPSPGAGASGSVAFTVAKGKVVTVPAAFRTGSRAQAGKQSAVFETSAALTARAEQSAIALSAVAPTNQFAPLASLGAIFGGLSGLSAAVTQDVYGTAGATFLRTLPLAFAARTLVATKAVSTSVFTTSRLFVSQTTRTIVLGGTSNKLAVGDYLLTVELGNQPTLFQVSSVSVDKTANTTTITWREPAGKSYQQSVTQPVQLFALRVKAGAFGNTAPAWLTLPASLTNSDQKHGPGTIPPPPFTDNWDDPGNARHFLPAGSTVSLDAVYDAAKATADNPGWLVLVPSNGATPKFVRFSNSVPVTVSDYSLNAKVSQLTLTESLPGGAPFGLRDTLLLTGAELLTLQNNLPLPDPVQGDTLILAGLFPNLQDAQPVILTGNLFNTSGPAPVTEAEFRQLNGPPLVDSANNLTTVKLNKPLANQYIRSTTTLMANVAAVTQGETVKDEVLGSSDASAFQSYPLKKNPLTYLPSTDPEGLSAVESTLIVTVNGVRWTEQPTLIESAPDAQEYTTSLDDSGQTTVTFGDSVNGARPTSGVNNIHARYRKGLGTSGNVPAGGVQQLIDNVAGLQQVTNPQPTAGGADPETLDRIQINAPASVRTFNRAVSDADYAAVALTFPGIAKASASWVTLDANRNALAQPYVQLTVATPDQTPILGTPLVTQLRSFLDKRRDPNVPLRILDFAPVFVDVALTVDLLDQYPRQATFASVQAALSPASSSGYFAFANLDFGENLHLSALYQAVQNVPGVSDVNITLFRRMDLDAANPSMVRDDIFISPTQIAVIGNDPAHPERGLLTVTQGTGGFVDQ
jgi:hypothetical protein